LISDENIKSPATFSTIFIDDIQIDVPLGLNLKQARQIISGQASVRLRPYVSSRYR